MNTLKEQTSLDLSNEPDFDGADYQSDRDKARLTGQIKRVFQVMLDGDWHSLRGISDITNDPEASISAQLRHLRKPKFGSHR